MQELKKDTIEQTTKTIDYEEISKKIINLSNTICFVEIYHKGKTHTTKRFGLEALLSKEVTKKSIEDSITRWKTRVLLADKLGKPVYAMAEYEKIIRVTIAFQTDGIIVVSMDPKGFHEIIIKEIIEIKNQWLS